MIGPGKYDDLCTTAREATGAQACLLIVLNGNRGSGFSVQSTDAEALLVLADVLETTARQMRNDLAWTAWVKL